MKKLTKTTALILSAVMLFGCTDNVTQSGVGDTTPPGESSGTDSKNENSSADNSSEIPNTSVNDGFVKNAEGYQTFSYEKDKYLMSSVTIFNKKEAQSDIYILPDNPEPGDIAERSFVLHEPVAIKCKIAGDSIYFDKKNKSGDVTVKNNNEGHDYLYGVFTPVVVEEIIDSFGYEPDFKVGDIVYIDENYIITKDFADYYEQNGNNHSDEIKMYEENIDDWNFNLKSELKKGDNADSEVIEVTKKLIEKRQHEIEEVKSYQKYVEENEESVITLLYGFPMQKDTEYFAFVNANKIEGTTDNNSYYFSYCEKYNLGDDKPESLGEDDEYVSFHYCYEYSWYNLSKKYGEHFKS